MNTPVTGDMLRRAMRQVPSPVTVVTAPEPEGGRGVTIGSFTSVSLEPPLVSINVNREAQMHDVLAGAPRFVVHVLRSDQAHLAERFAVPELSRAEQWEDVPHRIDAHGLPVLDEALAVLHCRREGMYGAGTHTLFVGRVERIEQRGPGEPLVYYRSAYHTVGRSVRSSRPGPVNRASSDTSLAPAPKKAKS